MRSVDPGGLPCGKLVGENTRVYKMGSVPQGRLSYWSVESSESRQGPEGSSVTVMSSEAKHAFEYKNARLGLRKTTSKHAPNVSRP